jgi:hypothetical protein
LRSLRSLVCLLLVLLVIGVTAAERLQVLRRAGAARPCARCAVCEGETLCVCCVLTPLRATSGSFSPPARYELLLPSPSVRTGVFMCAGL